MFLRSRCLPTSGVDGAGRADFGTTVGVGGGTPPRSGTAAKREVRSSSDKSNVSARARTVCGWGRLRAPRSRSLMPLALRPARAANSSCVRPVASLSCHNRAPKEASCPQLKSRVGSFVTNLRTFPWYGTW